MTEPCLVVAWGVPLASVPAGDAERVDAPELKRRLLRAKVLPYLLRYRDVELVAPRIQATPRPFLAAAVARALSRRSCRISDESGCRVPVTVRLIGERAGSFLRDLCARRELLRRVHRDLEGLENAQATKWKLNFSEPAVYFRTDLVFGLKSGGSVGHIAGVLNHLDRFAGSPIFLTTDRIPTVRPDLEIHLLPIPDRFWDFAELPSLDFNRFCEAEAARRLAGRQPSFVYQRYSIFNFAGLKLARDHAVPFVLEYNGSEVWIGKHWGQRLRHERLAERIETLNLTRADVVVVVSDASRDELLERGVAPESVLVNPNGVNIQRYAPEIEGALVRERHGLQDRLVVGFIGTFGRWHGAEVLADAFGRLLRRQPHLRDRVRLLLIGDGLTLPEVLHQLDRHQIADCCVRTGIVPQEQGPAHMAACDVLVSPHVPNPDGSRFFGSPTKLFEYMAMGKGIVASDLEQIGQVLQHDRTAWLVKPGDPDALAAGLRVLIDDPGRRRRLGRAAREEVAAKYTWEQHTRRIIDKLKERCG